MRTYLPDNIWAFYMLLLHTHSKYLQVNNNYIYADDKERLSGYNEAIDKPHSKFTENYIPDYPASKCSATALEAMGNRLLDWFSVIMADSSKRRRNRGQVESNCR